MKSLWFSANQRPGPSSGKVLLSVCSAWLGSHLELGSHRCKCCWCDTGEGAVLTSDPSGGLFERSAWTAWLLGHLFMWKPKGQSCWRKQAMVCVCLSVCACVCVKARVPTHKHPYTQVSKQTHADTHKHPHSHLLAHSSTQDAYSRSLIGTHDTLNICKGHIKQQCNFQF